MTRRRALAAVAAGTSALAGCAGVFAGPTMEQDTEIAFERADLTDAQVAHVRPFVYADLPSPQQRIVENALDGGYEATDDPVLERLVQRFHDRVDRQQAAYDGEAPDYLRHPYLRRDDRLYCCFLRVTDTIVYWC